MKTLKQILEAKTTPQIAKNKPPTAADQVKDRHEREKEQLKLKQDRESAAARERDFKKKEAEKQAKEQQKAAEKRAQQREDVDVNQNDENLTEYLEDGTEELVDAYKKSLLNKK
jgi:hypothetical protein